TLFGVAGAKAATMAEHGSADVAAVPPARLADLEARLPGEVRHDAWPAISYVFLNTRLPPFDRLSVRRALNLAVDRNELARLVGGAVVSDPTAGLPGLQAVLPLRRADARRSDRRSQDRRGPPPRRPFGHARNARRRLGRGRHLETAASVRRVSAQEARLRRS